MFWLHLAVCGGVREMKFICGQMWKIFGNLLLSLIWVANIILNVVAYVKETHWASIVCIVLNAILLVMDIVDSVITFRDLKRFCEKYDRQIERLCENIVVTEASKWENIKE